ncbi:MAG: amidohydrolase [Trueperaceae bacterium]|nr:amidohydrolase [Trueperaceae bacterium]
MTTLSDTIREAAQRLGPDVVALRRDFHRHPEIAFEEVRTSGIVAERLEPLGLTVRRNLGQTGVVAVLDSGTPGKTVLVRADMDALPMREERDVPYRATTDDAMHACGHDGHTAVLLGVAQLLSEQRDSFSGKVVFVFQPAEEIVGGAAAMLADGALEGLEPHASIGLHLSSQFPTGIVAVRDGPSMAATDAFTLQVHGHGGHAARPQETVDPVVAAAQIITGLQTLVSRETDPLDSAVISLTSVHGGSAHNIIPELVEIKGTLRSFRAETRQHLRERIAALSDGIAQSFRASTTLRWLNTSPAVVNDPARTEQFREVARAVVGAEHVISPNPIMGGDDMALWLEQAPGCYFFVGARNEAAGIDKPHHHPGFDIDEASLPLAVELLSKGVLSYLD